MSDGVGVVIRATMAVPIVFTLMYWSGRLITFLAQRWVMNLLMLGIQHGIENAAERRAKEIVEERGEEIAHEIGQQRAEEIAQQRGSDEISQRRIEEIAQRVAKETVERTLKEIAERDTNVPITNRETEKEEFRQFMRSKGVSDEDIDAFFHRVNQD